MLVARICDEDFPELDGKGGTIADGRWNSKGSPIVYTADSVALAALECAVHMKKSAKHRLLLLIEIPDTLDFYTVPYTPIAETSRQIGDEWLQSQKTAVMRVPSVIAPKSDNILLNPRHPAIDQVKVIQTMPFAFDARLLSGVDWNARRQELARIGS